MERIERKLTGADLEIRRGLFIQADGIGNGSVGGVEVPLRLPHPSYEETFADGVAAAKDKLRRIPRDLVITGETRLGNYEPQSVKRVSAMKAWAGKYPGVEMLDDELIMLNGTTVDRLVFYMQRKRLMVENKIGNIPDQELAALKKQKVEISDEEAKVIPVAELKALKNLNSDNASDMLLRAMDARIATVA